jgi:hypothetical protein
VIYSEFAEVAKETFVRVAMERDSGAGKELSKLTGLSEQESSGIAAQIDHKDQDHLSQSDQIVSILTNWHSNSIFTGPYGLPVELRFADSKANDFQKLVKISCPDADAEKILRQMISARLVKETEPGWFKVLGRSYIPEGNAPDFIDHMSSTLEDLANTLDHNHFEKNANKKLFQREVFTEDGIEADSLEAFTMFSNEKAQRLLEDIDNWIIANRKPQQEGQARVNTGFGIYHYVITKDD